MEKAYFPMEVLRVTQKAYSTYSHAGSMAVDFGGRDTGKDKLYCPFTAKVMRNRQNANGECYIESVEPVLWADGTVDYMHLTLVHGEKFHYPEGAVIPQGTYFYDEGGMGSGDPNKFAKHVHIEVGRGHSPKQQVKNAQGTYYTPGQVAIEKALWLRPGTVVMDSGGYTWKVDTDTGAVGKCLLVTATNCEYFAAADVNKPVGKLPLGGAYEITSQGKEELGAKWVQIKEGAGLWWVLALADRTQVLEEKPVPVEPQPTPVEETVSKAQYDELEQKSWIMQNTYSKLDDECRQVKEELQRKTECLDIIAKMAADILSEVEATR